MKFRYRKCVLCLFLLLVALFGFGINVSAENDVDFTVRTRPAENQIDTSRSYFYLAMKPSLTQTVCIDVINLSTKEIEVEAKISVALSNENGYIAYDGSVTGLEDESMKYRIEDVATILNPIVKLGVGETQTMEVAINAPDEGFEGIILGGINFQKLNEDEVDNGIGHQYAYNIAMILAGDDQQELQESKNLRFEGVDSAVVNGSKFTILEFINPEPAIMNNLDIDVEVIADTNLKKVIDQSTTGFRVAPNSKLLYQINWHKQTIKAGKYKGTITANSKEGTWNWDFEFEITDELAEQMNRESTNTLKMPSWFGQVSFLIGMVTLLIVGYLVYRYLRLQQDEGKGTNDEK